MVLAARKGGIALSSPQPARAMALPTGHSQWMGRSALLVGLLIAALSAGTARSAEPEHAPPRNPKPFPEVKLGKALRGDEAVRALGPKLKDVADWYGKSAEALAQELKHDKRAWLDRDGRLLFIDDFPTPANAGTATEGSTTAEAAPFPTDQTFSLHSRPGAKRVIYLDFRGGSVTGTNWNTNWGVGTINAQPYDLDGVPGSFNATELERIQYIWQRVAEDYAPFDVDVTTEEPTVPTIVEAINRSSTSDEYFGTRVMITQDWTAATTNPCSCGGIAYVGVFNDIGTYHKPAWVFFNQLGAGNEKYVAEAISHEAGHNLGLSHDGSSTTGYYAGHGSGATGWAPIMGVGYYKELVQWSKGEYPDANQTQDDFQVIQTFGGPLRPDDHGDTLGAATPLDVTGSTGTVSLQGSGLIGTRSDVDVFSFAASAGTLNLSVTPAPRGPNLDLYARLYDAAGNLLASANPSTTLDASLSAVVASAGTYYLFVEGVGYGSLSTGYSDYGSLGEYTITGTAPAPGGQPPVAYAAATPSSGTAPLAVQFASTGSYDPDGGALSYDWDFGDGSAHSNLPAPSHSYGAGSFVATLRVTDSTGSSDTSQVNINAAAPVQTVHVADIAMSLAAKRGAAQGKAVVTVKNANGVAISGATVSGTWSGIVTGSASGATTSGGSVSFTSASTKKYGALTFTVTAVTAAGYTYTPAANTESADSITR